MIENSNINPHLSVIKLLNNLSVNKFSDLLNAIVSSEIKQNNTALISELKEKTNFKTRELQEILEFLFSLRNIDTSNLEKITVDLEELLKSKEIQVNSRFKKYIKDLFLSFLKSNVFTTIKGVYLIFERERLVLEKKIYTDLRPVYSDNTDGNSQEVKAESVLLNLQIIFRNSKYEREQIIFAIDEQDLKDLEKEIKRAKDKLNMLKNDRSNLIFY